MDPMKKNENSPVKDKKISGWDIFSTLFRINAVTFGGGYTIIPIIRQEFVEKRGLLSDDDMLDIIAVAESGPGAMAVSTSYLLGMKLDGFFGGLMGILGSTLPPLMIITVVYFIYSAMANNPLVRAALRAMSGVIVAMLIFSVKGLFVPAVKKHKALSLALMAFAFVASYFEILDVAYIVLIMIVIGIVVFGFILKEDGENESEEVAQ